MKTLAAALGVIFISSAAFAQGAQPLSGPPASGGATQQQAPAAGTAGPQLRTIAQCREEARNQRLRGDERKNFMRDCARDIQVSCRDQAKAQRLDRDARREFITSCTGRPSRNAQRPGTEAAPPPSNMPPPAPPSSGSSGTQTPAQPPDGTQAPAPR
ncbi:MAG TPA: PsiF family protein [Propylenella sp.]|nr:PsiF family protein [Propylenella sp.]